MQSVNLEGEVTSTCSRSKSWTPRAFGVENRRRALCPTDAGRFRGGALRRPPPPVTAHPPHLQWFKCGAAAADTAPLDPEHCRVHMQEGSRRLRGPDATAAPFPDNTLKRHPVDGTVPITVYCPATPACSIIKAVQGGPATDTAKDDLMEWSRHVRGDQMP